MSCILLFQKIVYKKYDRTDPSVFKLVQLQCTKNFKDLRNLGIFKIFYYYEILSVIRKYPTVITMNTWNFVYVLCMIPDCMYL